MSEEEKKAIEEIRKIRDRYLHTFCDELTILLNIIETQQKEIEEDKKYIVKLTDKEYRKLVDCIREDYNQKIIDKLKKYKKKIEKLENKKIWNEPNDTIRYDTFLKYCTVLQELLESEE